MKKAELIKKIEAKAISDAENRRDLRFLNTVGFLAAKGLLETNYPITLKPNQQLFLKDVLWAGREVEPRILEVLPAAILRLNKHFDFDANRFPELAAVLEALKSHATEGPGLYGIPYAKIKVWVNFPLPDRRIKTLSEKKIPRTFRFKPSVIEALKSQAHDAGCTETEYLEQKILKH